MWLDDWITGRPFSRLAAYHGPQPGNRPTERDAGRPDAASRSD